MKNLINRLIKEEDGQGMTEYGMILGFVAVVAIVVLALFREQIQGLFTDATDNLDGVDFETEPEAES